MSKCTAGKEALRSAHAVSAAEHCRGLPLGVEQGVARRNYLCGAGHAMANVKGSGFKVES